MAHRRRSPIRFRTSAGLEQLEPRRLLVVPFGDPLITELMSTNQGFLTNEYSATDDWIELYNPGPDSIDLFGWYLTDRRNELHQWKVPVHKLMPPDSYLVVFASGRDLVSPFVGELHTNFKLNNGGEYLGLVKPDGTTIASEYEPEFPELDPNVSFGLTSTFDDTREFATPTPGMPNTPFFKADVFSDPHGLYDSPFRLAVDLSKLVEPVHYTLDGSIPTAASPRYVSSILIDRTTTVRVKSLAVGAAPTVYTQTYIFPQSVLNQPALPAGFPAAWQPNVGAPTPADYQMDPQVIGDPAYAAELTEMLLALPSVSVTLPTADLFGTASGIYANPTQSGDNWERAASVELIYPSGDKGVQIDAGVRIEGSETRDPANTPKHSLRIRFDADYGLSELDYPVFENSDIDEFDSLSLRAAWNDSWLDPSGAGRPQALLARDQWLRDTHRAMGQPAADGQFVHLYLNGLYWGVYNLTERIDDNFAANRFGGRASDYDVIDTGALADGQINAWNAMLAIAAGGLQSAASYQSIQQYLDVTNFIDYMIVNIFAGKADLEGGDWFAIRNRTFNQRFKFYAWDSEQTLRDASADLSNVTGANSPAYLYGKLRENAEFRLAFADRLHEHMTSGGALTPAAATARWQAVADTVNSAIVAESARWGDYRLDVHPHSSGPYELYSRTHWSTESERIVDSYLPDRTETVLSQFIDNGLYPNVAAPTLSRGGGEITSGQTVTIGVPAGQIYYTLDGSDPRLPGGGIKPGAILYQGPITLTADTRIRARALFAGQWSAGIDEAFFLPIALKITELHYHAAAPQAQDSFYDFIELTNAGSTTIDLSALEISDAVTFSFADGAVQSLLPGERVLVVASLDAFETRYTTAGLKIAGEYSGQLGNAGERLVVSGQFGQRIVEASYTESWYKITDGDGYSLVAREEPGSTIGPSSSAYWRPSFTAHGNPGFKDNGHNPEAVVVNEALTHNDDIRGDWLELHNTTDQPIDIGGWYLSENDNNLQKYRIAPGTILPAHGYIDYSVQENFENPEDPGRLVPFKLDKLGETLYLTSPSTFGISGGYRHEASTTYGFNSTTHIRYTNSTGEVQYVPSSWQTPDQPNAPPAVAHIWDHQLLYLGPVINEVMYQPPVGGDEYIELFNPHDVEIPLTGPFDPPRITDAVFYNFAHGIMLAPRGYALVVPIDPAVFRAKYNVPAATQIFGPYTGELLNTGERVVYARAAESEAYIPYATVDSVYYGATPGWPQAAAGQGASLNRRSPWEYGNDILNWTASASGGTPGRPNVDAAPTAVRGAVFRDTNHNGVREAGEAPMPGVRVYVDIAANGQFDQFEAFVTTDASGNYDLTQIAGGPHAIRADLPEAVASKQVNVVAGQILAAVNFALSPIAGRHVFYNRSRFDGVNGAASAADDVAIATDKVALLPGQTATFANYTSYVLGINGVMVDLFDLPATPTAGDFSFRVGNSNTPGQWTALATMPQISVRSGAGVAGSDRITLIWPDGAVKNQWLQITVKATANTGLTSPDTFYFGNAIGEAGNSTISAQVTISDEVFARNNPRSVANPAGITYPYDFNRDMRVTVTDMTIARNNRTTVVNMLKLISVPPALVANPLHDGADGNAAPRAPFVDVVMGEDQFAPAHYQVVQTKSAANVETINQPTAQQIVPVDSRENQLVSSAPKFTRLPRRVAALQIDDLHV